MVLHVGRQLRLNHFHELVEDGEEAPPDVEVDCVRSQRLQDTPRGALF